MLITNSKELEKYTEAYRLWQGIPGIEVTKNGRVFITFYSGGTKEQITPTQYRNLLKKYNILINICCKLLCNALY